MRVNQIMSRNVVTVPVEATIAEAAELMKAHDIGFLPVVTGDIVVGVVTERDLVVRGICERVSPYLTPVRAVMTATPVWCYDHDVLTDAADILADNHVHRLIVIDTNNRITGLLSIDDLAAHMSSDRLLGIVLRRVAVA